MLKDLQDDLTHLMKPATELTKPVYIGPAEPQNKYFDPIENRESAKPWGGFWTSPSLEKEENISPFARFEDRALVQPHHEVWTLQPTKDATVLFIDTGDKLEQLPTIQPKHNGHTYLDYEQIFSNTEIDGIHITQDVARLKSFSKDHHLGSWDFTSTLWSDLDWIQCKVPDGTVSDH